MLRRRRFTTLVVGTTALLAALAPKAVDVITPPGDLPGHRARPHQGNVVIQPVTVP
jgi:hypothetical protein